MIMGRPRPQRQRRAPGARAWRRAGNHPSTAYVVEVMSTVGRSTRLRWVAVATGVCVVVGGTAFAPDALRLVGQAVSPYEPVSPAALVPLAGGAAVSVYLVLAWCFNSEELKLVRGLVAGVPLTRWR